MAEIIFAKNAIAFVSIIFGILILLFPKVLRYLVGLYFLLVGIGLLWQ